MGETLKKIGSYFRSSVSAEAIRPAVRCVRDFWKHATRYPLYLYRFGAKKGRTVHNTLHAPGRTGRVRFQIPQLSAPLFLRAGTTDVAVFEQIFVDLEYGFSVPTSPTFMVDAGAHIGLASLYFAQRFPECQILALEPEPQNFELLQKNTGSYSNITPMQAALWGHSTTLSLVDQKCGNWAFQMEEREGEKEIPAITVEKAKNLLEASMIDILKMDIEGAEEGVLENYFEWGGCVRTVIVELHGESRVYGSDKVKKIESEEKVKRRNIGENVVLTWE